MQKMVNKIYQKKRFDKVVPVSRFEFEQRNIRERLDTADIYHSIARIENALETAGIDMQEPFEGEEYDNCLVDMVKEDRSQVQRDLLQMKYDYRMGKLARGSWVEKARQKIMGAPQDPSLEYYTVEVREEEKETEEPEDLFVINPDQLKKKEDDRKEAEVIFRELTQVIDESDKLTPEEAVQ